MMQGNLGSLAAQVGEGLDASTGGRVDRDEQLFGTIAEDGVIIDVVDADRGIVQVVLASGGQVTGKIQKFTAPVLTRSSKVLVLQTQHSFAHILPLAQYPAAFIATILRVNGSGEAKTAEARHSLTALGDNGVIVAPVAYGLDIAEADIVGVITTPRARVTALPLLTANHIIAVKIAAGGA